MLETETTSEYDCKDEVCCDWYKCNECGDTMITFSSNYCPGCGKKIIRKYKK